MTTQGYLREPAFSAVSARVCGIATLSIEDGEITEFDLGSGLAGAFALGVGEYLFILERPFATTAYQVRAWDDALAVSASVPRATRAADSFIVHCEAGGAPADPETLNVQIYGCL